MSNQLFHTFNKHLFFCYHVRCYARIPSFTKVSSNKQGQGLLAILEEARF